MNKTVNREYKTTFILDLRETEDDVAKVSADIKEILSSLGASVSESEDPVSYTHLTLPTN